VPPSALSDPPRGGPRSPATEHVLIVEDEPDIAFMLRLVFEEGYLVTLAGDLAQARAALSHAALPDLILLDVMLPDGNGLEFCREVKDSQPLIPVVVMTAYARHGLVTEADARACGADGFVPKPFDVDALLATAAELVRRAA
jgi:two-component system OmpR family response regulator